MTSESQRLRVAIIGAGIGGLTLALALKDSPHIDVDIYEAASQITEIGAGVALWPRAWPIVKDLGQEELFNALLDKPFDPYIPRLIVTMVKADQKQSIRFGEIIMPGGNIPMHRADVQNILLRGIPPSCDIHLRKRLTEYIKLSDGSVKLTFNDGHEATCDVLVGADGLNSAVRRTMANNESGVTADPVWSGTEIYRALVPADRVKEQMPNHSVFKRNVNLYVGKDQHVTLYRISHGSLINVAVFKSQPSLEGTQTDTPMVSESTREECISGFTSWDQEVQVVLGKIEKVSKWHLNVVKPLETFVSGNVALLGDAAHAMPPHCGAGAGQAMEDAYILAHILRSSKVNRTNVSLALKVYDEIRQPMANFVQKMSREVGLLYELNTKELSEIRVAGDIVDSNKLDYWRSLIHEAFRWTLEKELVDDQKGNADTKLNERL